MDIGEKIRQIRLLKGLSQENVAESLHISTTAYGDIERNKTEITFKRMIKLAKIFEVDLNQIINEYPSQNNCEAEKEKLKAELLLAQIESFRWKERFMRAVFSEKTTNSNNRQRIGFK